MRREQAGGRRRAALLSGNLAPLLADLARRLGECAPCAHKVNT
jgi:hypothetical protein